MNRYRRTVIDPGRYWVSIVIAAAVLLFTAARVMLRVR